VNEKIKKIALPVVIALFLGAGGFLLGMSYQKSQVKGVMRPDGQLGSMRGSGGAGGILRKTFDPALGSSVAGEIIEKNEKTITIKLQDGSSEIVLLPDGTEFRKTTAGSQDDLQQGKQVFVIGKENTDGIVTAQTVQIGALGMRN